MTKGMPSPSKRRSDPGSGNARGARLLLEYTGTAAKYLAILGFSVWAGLKIDRMIPGEWPLLVWLLPMVCVVGLVVKAVRDTSK
jgi:hypothetical protein